jgi:hypothetical protein
MKLKLSATLIAAIFFGYLYSNEARAVTVNATSEALMRYSAVGGIGGVWNVTGIPLRFNGDLLDSGDTIAWQIFDNNNTLLGSSSTLWNSSSTSAFMLSQGLNPDLTTLSLYVVLSAPTGSFDVGPALVSSFVNGSVFEFIQFESITAIAAVPGPIAGAGLPGVAITFSGLLAWWRRSRRCQLRARSCL